MHTTTKEIYEAAVERYNRGKNNPANFDEGIAGIVHALNLYEGVATVWSCSGHPEDGVYNAHVIFVVNDDGVKVLSAISDFTYHYDFDFIHENKVSLSTKRLISFRDVDGHDVTYKCWRLSMNTKFCSLYDHGGDKKFWDALVTYLAQQPNLTKKTHE